MYDAEWTHRASTDDAVSSTPDGSASSDGTEPSVSCSARPNAECGEACEEVCNSVDDDCDGLIDEVASDASCQAPHSKSSCLFGQCILVECESGYRDCDQLQVTGCEVGRDDPEHCGRCDRACKLEHARSRCEDGTCQVDRCEEGYADCDDDRRSCESRIDTRRNCGSCGAACRPAHAVSQCEEGRCGEAVCEAGHGDCDGDPNNGCEQPLDSLEHCGACGARCAKASCPGGVCTAADCSLEPGRADCDGDEASCEVDLTNDPAHCGRCDNPCAFGQVEAPHAQLGCEQGACRALCDAGYGDCDGDYENGCEQRLNSLEDCGACGARCSIDAADATCREGRCELEECETDRADCDGDRVSCESELDSVDSCGACDVRCELPNARADCAGSRGERSCAIVECASGFLDCDGSVDNGCERDGRTPGEGGDGPCAPDNSCRKASLSGHDYFICGNSRSWSDARERCRSQRGGDLLTLDDARERDFVQQRISTRHWIGHSDRDSEGLWVWTRTGVPFWRGQANGRALEGRFAQWARDEPNGSGNCGALYESGLLDDLSCDRGQPFVCEVMPDACPDNPNKLDPGQCGCAAADRDTDEDGVADCPG